MRFYKGDIVLVSKDFGKPKLVTDKNLNLVDVKAKVVSYYLHDRENAYIKEYYTVEILDESYLGYFGPLNTINIFTHRDGIRSYNQWFREERFKKLLD